MPKAEIQKKPNPKHNWSEYQKNFFVDIAKGEGHTIIEAAAGSAKTTSAIESFKYIPKGKKTIVLAFNKIIQKELQSRAPSYVDSATFHSFGLRAITKRFGKVELNEYKCSNIVRNMFSDISTDLITNIIECVSFCKYGLIDSPREIENLINRFGIDTCEFDKKSFVSAIIKTLAKCKEETALIDYNDMCWFPFVYNLSMDQYDYVYVEEFQDLNKSQLLIAKKCCKPIGGRIIAIGDPKQCVDENTVIFTPNGNALIKNIQIGDMVHSYHNGKSSFQKVLNKVKSDWEYGIKITTKSGKSLIMSPTHKIWAKANYEKKSNIINILSHSVDGTRIIFDGLNLKFDNYSSAFSAAQQLADQLNASVSEDLVFNNDKLRLIKASGLTIGMEIISYNDVFFKDEIISLEKVAGTFYDIEVENTNNFIGNDILSHNSIYSWRMADNSIIPELKQEDKTKILSLPISYRCPKNVIDLAKLWVPQITASPNAIDGNIENISLNKLYDKAKPGCFILSRVNAPLIKICMNFIRRGIKANIRGKDVGSGLTYLLNKSRKTTNSSFLTWLEKWKDEEVKRYQEKKISTNNLMDKYECLVTLCEEFDTMTKVRNQIDHLFNDDPKNVVVLGSIHSMKGLEADNVFLLYWTMRVWFDAIKLENISVDEPNEEMNLAYVAVTRAKKNLYLVDKFE